MQRGSEGNNSMRVNHVGIQNVGKGKDTKHIFKGRRTFVEVVTTVREASGGGGSYPFLRFESNIEVKANLSKAFMGVILHPGSTCNIQTHFEVEGVFTIKVTPMGANLCLMEELEEGYISELIGDGSTWWKQWFKEIRPWSLLDVDEEIVMWLRVYGVP